MSILSSGHNVGFLRQSLLQIVSQVNSQFGLESTISESDSGPVLRFKIILSDSEYEVCTSADVLNRVSRLTFRYTLPFAAHEKYRTDVADFINQVNATLQMGCFHMNLETGELFLRTTLLDSSTQTIDMAENIRTIQNLGYRILTDYHEVLRKWSVPVPVQPTPGTLHAFTMPGTKILFKSVMEIETARNVSIGDRFVLKTLGSATYVGCHERVPYIVPDRDLYARPWTDDSSPLEFIRKFGDVSVKRTYVCNDRASYSFDVTLMATHRFNLLAGDRVVKRQRFGNVIGVLNQSLYVHYDGSPGAEIENEYKELNLVCRYGYPGTSVVKVASQNVEIDVSSLSTAEYGFAPGDLVTVPYMGRGIIVGLCDDRIIVQPRDRPEPGAWKVTIDKDLHSVGFQLVCRPGGSADASVHTPNGMQKLEVGFELFHRYGFSAGDAIKTQTDTGLVLGATQEDLVFLINRNVQVFKGSTTADLRQRGFTLSIEYPMRTTHEIVKPNEQGIIKMVGPFLNTPQPLPEPPVPATGANRAARDAASKSVSALPVAQLTSGEGGQNPRPRSGPPVPLSNMRNPDSAVDAVAEDLKAKCDLDEQPDESGIRMERMLIEELLKQEEEQGGPVDSSNPLAATTTFLDTLKTDNFLLTSRDVSIDMKDGQPVTLGKGAFGVVYSGTLWEVEEVAIKRVRLKTKRQYQDVKEEFKILAKLNHPNVLRIYGVYTFKSEVYLVLDKCSGGTMEDYVKKNPGLSWRKRVEFLIDIGKALNFLHRREIIHRDIKLANMLLRGGNALLADFGLSRITGCAVAGEGTPLYMAPELTKKGGSGTASVDIYAFGIAIWYMDNPDANPYPGVRTAPDLYQRVQRGQRPPLTNVTIPEPVIGVMTECWHNIPESRPPISKVVLVLKDALKRIS